MDSLNADLIEYHEQLQRGVIQKAYRGLMEYLMGLRTHFENRYPDTFVSGSLYPGVMDMTYFSCTPGSLKKLNLKIAIVFLHEEFRFEAWLGGVNKQVQAKYWKVFKESGWNKYRLVPSPKGVDAILETVLVGDPDFSDPAALTQRIERAVLDFTTDVENFLSNHSG